MLPHPTSRKFILMLSLHFRLGLPSGLFRQVSPQKSCMHLSRPILATCPAHLIRLDFITPIIFGDACRLLSSSLYSFLYPPLTSSLGPNLLSTLLKKPLGVRSSLNVSDQVSHPYKTTGIIIAMYILIFKFLYSRLEDKRFCCE